MFGSCLGKLCGNEKLFSAARQIISHCLETVSGTSQRQCVKNYCLDKSNQSNQIELHYPVEHIIS